MPEIFGIDKLFSVCPKKRFGRFNQFGTSQFGYSRFGEYDFYFVRNPFGRSNFGVEKFGDITIFSGIYRTDNVSGYTRYYREPYFIVKNPRSASQQFGRQLQADAVLAWQALTASQKLVYNNKARYKNYSGYNLFLSEYMSCRPAIYGVSPFGYRDYGEMCNLFPDLGFG